MTNLLAKAAIATAVSGAIWTTAFSEGVVFTNDGSRGTVQEVQSIGQTDQNKTCSSCSLNLPTTTFYSKGDRIDSKCKSCVSKSKSKKYKQQMIKKKIEAASSRRRPIVNSIAIGTPTLTVIEKVSVILGSIIKGENNATSDYHENFGPRTQETNF